MDKRYVSEGVLEFDVYIDTSSFEMYACDGAYLFTARIQPLTSSNGISISSSGSVRFRELTLIELKNIRGIDVENAKAVHLNRTEIVTTADCVEGEFVYASAYDGTDDYSVEIADASIARITKEKNGFYVYPLTEGNSEIKVTSGDRFIIIPLTVYSKSLLSTDIDAYSVTKATLEYRPDGILLSPAGGDGFALGDVYQKDLDFSADVTPYNDSKAAALMFRAKDTNNFYCFTADYGAKVAKIWMKNAGTSTTLTSVKYEFEEGKTYNLRVKCTDKRIDAFINGERVITVLNSVHSEGLLGLNAYNAPYIFNNVKVVSDASINVVSQISSYKSIVGTVGKSENGFYLSYGSGDGFAVSDVDLSDFEYSSDVKITNNTPAAALVFRYSEGNFYCATVDAGANVVKLWKRVNGATTVLRTVSVTIDCEKVYNVSVKADGKIIEIYLDGKLLIKAADASHSDGRLGFNVFKGGAFFNNIKYSAK